MTNPSDDMQGMARRLVPSLRSYFPIPIQADPIAWQTATNFREHFDQPTFDGSLAWATDAPFDGAPSYVNLTSNPSLLVLENNDITEDHFLARSNAAGVFNAIRCCVSLDSYIGVRIDDGTNTNYMALQLENGATTGTVRLVQNSNTGGVFNQVVLVNELPHTWYCLAIRRTGAGVLIFYTLDTPSWRFLGFPATSWTTTRGGIAFGQRGVATNDDRRGYVDWFLQSTAIQG